MIKAKQMLREIRTGRIELKALEEKRELIEAKAIRITRDLSGMPMAHGKTDLSSSVVGLMELDETIKQQIAEVTEKEKTAINLIARMDSAKHRSLLTLYYIAGDYPHTWEDVAKKMGYSLPAVFKIHGKALLDLQEIMDA